MHRSGTSMLTGTLELAGVYLGAVNEVNENNLKGNRENPFLYTFHENILRQSGGRWNNPPFKIAWSPQNSRMAKYYIQSYKGQKMWGFKDPRSILVIEYWRRLIPELEFVGIFRHPSLVAKSLMKRNNFTEEHALYLWLRYNRRLLRFHKKNNFPIIEFDPNISNTKYSLNRLFEKLNLDFDPGFLDESLVNNTELKELKFEVKEVYEKLRAIALK